MNENFIRSSDILIKIGRSLKVKKINISFDLTRAFYFVETILFGKCILN